MFFDVLILAKNMFFSSGAVLGQDKRFLEHIKDYEDPNSHFWKRLLFGYVLESIKKYLVFGQVPILGAVLGGLESTRGNSHTALQRFCNCNGANWRLIHRVTFTFSIYVANIFALLFTKKHFLACTWALEGCKRVLFVLELSQISAHLLVSITTKNWGSFIQYLDPQGPIKGPKYCFSLLNWLLLIFCRFVQNKHFLVCILVLEGCKKVPFVFERAKLVLILLLITQKCAKLSLM